MTDAQAREIATAEATAAREDPLWWGRPDAARVALRSLPLSLLGLPFAGFAAFWIAGAAGFRWPDLSRGGFALFPLFGLPFLVVGLAIVFSPAFAYRAARRTVYVVTRSGVLVVRAGRTRKIQRHVIEDASQLRTTVRADGTGDLVLGRRLVAGRSEPARLQGVTLVGIPEVRRVERLVASLARPVQPATPEPAWAQAVPPDERAASSSS